MRPRGSITGPVVLITLGCLFLAHTFSPGFDVIQAVSRYWPVLLIGWGVLGLVEVVLRGFRGTSVPVNGVSGGAWFFVVLVIFFGCACWLWSNPETWWHRIGMDQSMALIGNAHDFSFDPIHKETGPAPRVVIESFRGDAKITGTDASEVTVTGHKTIRSLNPDAAQKANETATVETTVEGNTVIIRCNQDHSGSRVEISADLEIAVPKGATVEAVGRNGDFDISDIQSVDVSSDNADVKIAGIAGDVKIDTRQSSDVDCSNVKGAVTLRGRGDDVNLTGISGSVSVEGDYTGTISLRAIANAVRIDSMHTKFDAQSVPGTLSLQRGSLEANNLVGPVKVSAQATDVSINGFRQALDLTVDKGDVDLKPGFVPLSDITINAKSGDVSVNLPAQANFAMNATTAHGDISNDFGAALTSASSDNGSTLSGKIGTGPQIAITAVHGDISIKKAAGAAQVQSVPSTKEPAQTESI